MRRNGSLAGLAGAIALSGMAMTASADDDRDTPFADALTGAELSLDLRWRFEHVSDDAALRDANASTLRTLIGARTGRWHGFSARVELNNTAVVVTERYDSGPSGNGRDEFAEVLDPKTTRVNQAYVDFHRMPDTVLRMGNQRIVHDNQRHVGNDGFRQQEQTFEGVRLVSELGANVTVDYAHVQRVNRVMLGSDDRDVSHQLVNLAIVDPGVGMLATYGYFLDYRDAAPQSSTATLGVRLSGAITVGEAEVAYAAEYARQEDHGSFPGDYRARYRLVETTLTGPDGLSVTAGREVLGSDGDAGKGFETRLGSLHRHNGWTDRFPVPPAAGLEDSYLRFGFRGQRTQATAVWHDFRAVRGDARYGTEWGLRLQRPIGEYGHLALKYARYSARDHAEDTDKLWLTAGFGFQAG